MSELSCSWSIITVGLNGEDCTKGIVQGVDLNNNGFVGDPMSEDRGRGEGGLKGLERLSSGEMDALSLT